jgi:hypothetical protein
MTLCGVCGVGYRTEKSALLRPQSRIQQAHRFERHEPDHGEVDTTRHPLFRAPAAKGLKCSRGVGSRCLPSREHTLLRPRRVICFGLSLPLLAAKFTKTRSAVASASAKATSSGWLLAHFSASDGLSIRAKGGLRPSRLSSISRDGRLPMVFRQSGRRQLTRSRRASQAGSCRSGTQRSDSLPSVFPPPRGRRRRRRSRC